MYKLIIKIINNFKSLTIIIRLIRRDYKIINMGLSI